jgi:predicted transcriptional regulator
MEPLCDLLFELSNEDRLSILRVLEKGPMNLSAIAKKLDFTAQGTSRNASRLVHTSLITRNPEGEYLLTTWGRTALRLLDSYKFLSRQKGYFLSHNTDEIPLPFQYRFGELVNHDEVTEILDVVANIERELREAEEYEWYITPGRIVSPSNLDGVIDALDRGVKIRIIEPTGYAPSEKILKEASHDKLAAIEKHWKAGNAEARYLNRVGVRLYMTEKEVAIFALPRSDGVVDTVGFHSKDPGFIAWCEDLYDYYWKMARTEPWFWTFSARL